MAYHPPPHRQNLRGTFEKYSDFSAGLDSLKIDSIVSRGYIVGMVKKIYIIDGHSHIYAAYYAPMRQRLTSPAGEPTKATYIFTTAILGLIKNLNPDMLVVAMDSKAPSFRTEIYPEYKAHRPPMPDDLPSQIKRIEQILAAMNIPMIRIDGFEADDIIGTLARKASAEGIDAYICSKDKDMLQLLDEHICTYDLKTGECKNPKTFKEEMKIEPIQFIDVLALQGDAVDNVPGVPDVGPKTALEWVQRYGSIENLYEHAGEITGKRGDNLRAAKEQVALSRKLVTINCSVPIDIDYELFALKEPNREKLTELFNELGFTRILSQMGLSAAETTAQTQATAPAVAGEQVGISTSRTVPHDYQLIDTQEKFDAFFAELKKQKIFAVDTETTSINPMRAELVGISFSWQEHKGFYLAVKAPLCI